MRIALTPTNENFCGMYSFKKPMIVWLMLFLFSTKSVGQSIFGRYESNWNDTLVIYPDSSFRLSKVSHNDMVNISRSTMTGKLSITPKRIYFKKVNEVDESSAFWTCHSLKRKLKKLVRPFDCQPTHRFLIFRKVQGFND